MLTTASLFSRVSAALVTLTATGWRPSVRTFEDFPNADGGSERNHMTYSLGIPATSFLQGRQQTANRVRTDLRVRFLWRIRPTDRDADYLDALTAEATIRAAVLATSSNPDLKIAVPLGADATRRELPSGTGPMVLVDLPFVAFHTLPLT